MREAANKLRSGTRLTPLELIDIARCFATGTFKPEEAAEFLLALEEIGVTALEIVAFAEVFRSYAVPIVTSPKSALDTCGTGGGIPSWNISTAAAIIAASAGITVAKHGNRAVTSKCGSADVLEALGVNIQAEPQKCWENAGIAFLFAPKYHPAFAHVGPIRRSLSSRTIFNSLGPLLNPAGASRQLIGVRDPALAPAVLEAAVRLGAERAVVVHGADGMDEVSPCGETLVWTQAGGETWNLNELGVMPLTQDQIAPGNDAHENARKVMAAIQDVSSLEFSAVLPSAAAALWIGGAVSGRLEGKNLARDCVESGQARMTLKQWIEASQIA